MRLVFAIALLAHGIAHLVGFLVPWKLITSEDTPYRTTVLGGALDLGEAGIRVMGVVWLLAALGLVVAAVGLVSSQSWGPWFTQVMVLASLVLSIAGLPDSKIGLAVNLVLIVALVLAPRVSWLGVLAP